MNTNQTNQNVQQPIQNKNMVACKTCGAQIAKSAKVCPACGVKNKKKSLLKILIPLVIVLVLIGAFVVKTMVFNGVKATLNVNGTEYSWTEYRKMYHDYYLNGKATEFTEKFAPATAELSGKITKISNAIIGETMTGNMPSKTTLMCFEITIDDGATYNFTYKYYDESKYDFSHLAVGDKVTVKGTVTEESLFPTNRIEENLDAQLEIEGPLEGISKQEK